MEALDNAGVYRLTDDLAIIETVDFFTPVVDDPYAFGQIAAANSLSDVYTMGGRPVVAMNIVCFPIKSLGISVLKDILRGGVDKMREAGTVLVGGHSVEDPELKYGLSVTGTIHPDRLITNSGARPGDKLLLTKPLGTGILSTALKAKLLDDTTTATLIKCMATLNNKASELMQEAGVKACTDITGFGLIGHVAQLAQNSGVGVTISWASLPLLPRAEEFARQKLLPGGLQRNREFYFASAVIDGKVPAHIQDILFDPQTSGGLLMCVAPDKAGPLLERLRQAGVTAAIIGEAVSQPKGTISVS